MTWATPISGKHPNSRKRPNAIWRRRRFSRQCRTAEGIANCLLMLGAVQRQTGNHDDALRFYDQALATCRTLGWRHGESYVLSNLGNTYFTLGDFVQAGENHRDALSIRRDVADRQGRHSTSTRWGW